MKLTSDDIATLVLFTCLLLLVNTWINELPTPHPNPSPNPAPSPIESGLPIPGEDFHFLVVRQSGGPLSPSQSAILGSQIVENEADDAGEYRVFFDGQSKDEIPEIYHAAIHKMSNGDGLPQVCISYAGTGLHYMAPIKLDDTPEFIISKIREIRGAR